MTLLVAMIADDLTGALDAAAPFAERGLRTIVVLTPDGLHGVDRSVLEQAEVVCVNSASREITVDEAQSRVTAATAALLAHAPALMFKKVDSRLKGHLQAELGAMLAASGRSDIVLAPALPDMGRLVIHGAVTGFGVVEPIDSLARCVGLPVEAPDIVDQERLDQLGAMLFDRRHTTLAAGARGLALALAKRFPARPNRPFAGHLPLPALLAIGSRDPITRAQIDLVMRALRPSRVLAVNGAVPDCVNKSAITLVTVEAGETVEPDQVVAARFARGVAELAAVHPPASILISGGETAYAVLTQLGVGMIEVGGEALPGIPFAIAKIGGKQVVVLTKSGGFGAPDTISMLLGVHPALDQGWNLQQ